MSGPWTGPRARRELALSGLILLVSVALAIIMMQRAETEIGGAATPQTEPYTLLEVWPAAGATTTFAAAAIEATRAVPYVIGVQRYVVAVAQDAYVPELRVIGVDVTAPLRLPRSSQAMALELLTGRAFGPEDAERPVAIVTENYAKAGKTTYGYEIAGMVGHNPPIRLGGAEVQVIGMFTTSAPSADGPLLLPLATAERLFGLSGQANGLYVQVDEPGNVEQVERELRALLGPEVVIARVAL